MGTAVILQRNEPGSLKLDAPFSVTRHPRPYGLGDFVVAFCIIIGLMNNTA